LGETGDATIARAADGPSEFADPAAASPVSHEPIVTGQLLGGRYRLERKLGEGGMGVVYLASDQEVQGEVFAIKVLAPEIRERPDALELLREEVRKTRTLARRCLFAQCGPDRRVHSDGVPGGQDAAGAAG
jgi:hypothetical protein